jgi:hypothetical protein
MNMTNLVFISERNYYGFDWEVFRCKRQNILVGICHGFSAYEEASNMKGLKEKMVNSSREKRRTSKGKKR